jgi:hypothetical protein
MDRLALLVLGQTLILLVLPEAEAGVLFRKMVLLVLPGVVEAATTLLL